MNTYCKVFLQSELDREALYKLIVSIADARPNGLRSFTASTFEGDISNNEDYDLDRLTDEDGFLFYKYYLDLDAITDNDSQYIKDLGRLLRRMREADLVVVPACDFEEELAD